MSETNGKPTRKSVMRKKEIVQAILQTQSAISALPKTERNNYGNYNYATIDQYYEDVASCARKNGLTWVVSEEEIVVGRESTLHRYVVELQYKDGTTYPEYARLSVLHPLMGAQATGSAMSYAEKVFMRMVFKVPTGEFDADATDGKNVRTSGLRSRGRGRPRPEQSYRDLGPVDEPEGISGSGEVYYGSDDPSSSPPDEPPKRNHAQVEREMTAFAKDAPTTAALNAFWKAQQHVLREVQAADPACMQRIQSTFAKRKSALLAASTDTVPTRSIQRPAPPPVQPPTPVPRTPTRTLRPPV